MSGSVWLDMNTKIQRQLALQVSLSLDRHDTFLDQHGLETCGIVIDVGTGSGQFLKEVATRYPGIRFVGIVNKPHMVEAASNHAVSNVDWVLADALDDATAQAVERADGILMRYFLLHLQDTCSSLKRLLDSARPGTRLWIMDLDLDNNICDPPSQVFADFVGLVQRFCDDIKVDIRTGSHLPAFLDACGFDVDEVAPEPFNSKEVERVVFIEYVMREALLYHYHLYGSPGEKQLQPLREFLEGLVSDQDQFVQYGMVMISATRRPH